VLATGLGKEKMTRMPLVEPVLVGRFEFVEGPPDNQHRHSTFISLRED